MLTHEAVDERIAKANAIRDGGDRESARLLLGELWNEIGPDGDPIHRCGVAHHIADTQDDFGVELTWDLTALEVADTITIEQRRAVQHLFSVDAFYASLHLNLADDYSKLGDPAKARAHLAKAHKCLRQTGDLPNMGPNDKYGRSIRAELQRLSAALGALALLLNRRSFAEADPARRLNQSATPARRVPP
jgi:tetratricopeptide (TPR) repeat protein